MKGSNFISTDGLRSFYERSKNYLKKQNFILTFIATFINLIIKHFNKVVVLFANSLKELTSKNNSKKNLGWEIFVIQHRRRILVRHGLSFPAPLKVNLSARLVGSFEQVN